MLDIQFVVGLIIGVIIFLGGIHFYGKYATMLKTSTCPNILMKVDSKYFLFNSKLEQVPGVNPIQFDTLEDYIDFLKWQQTVGIKCPVLHVEKVYDAQGNRVFKIRPSATDAKGGLPPSPPPYVASKEASTDVINKTTVASTATSTATSTAPTKIVPTFSSNPNCGKMSADVEGHSGNLLSQLWAKLTDIPTKLTPAPKVSNDGKIHLDEIEYPDNLLPCPEPKFKEFSDDPMDINWGGEDYTEKSVRAGKYAGSEITTSPIH